MVIRNISQAKAELSALVERVEKGGDVVIARAGKPVAKLVPYQRPSKARTPGLLKGKIRISPDFDSLPEDMAEVFGMKEPNR